MSYGVNPTFSSSNSNYSIVGRDEFNRVSALVAELKNRIDYLEREVMSAAMWCNPGKHAFSADDDGMETLSRVKKVKLDDYGGVREQAYTVHICAEHMRTLDPFSEHVNENKTQALEAWNEGFEAGSKLAE